MDQMDIAGMLYDTYSNPRSFAQALVLTAVIAAAIAWIKGSEPVIALLDVTITVTSFVVIWGIMWCVTAALCGAWDKDKKHK